MSKSVDAQLNKNKNPNIWIWDILLIGILLIGAYYRFVGINWDGTQHLHPDERFLTMVETSINPVQSIGEYFNTDISSLNPHNRGYGFYVYGTFPLYIVRYVAEWVGMSGYDEVNIVGRCASAVFDLGVILLVYLIAIRLYKNYRMALMAAGFTSFSVLQIQLSHFFTVDTFANFFIFLSFYFAVRIMTGKPGDASSDFEFFPGTNERHVILSKWTSCWAYILFGLALGMAAASKVSTAPAALLLPSAVLLRYIRLKPEDRTRLSPIIIRNIIIAAITALIIFRICQPMAFSGPGFFGLKPNDKWVQNLKDLSQQSGGDVDFPPALQWARRPITFAWTNMVEWGMGLPYGLLAWTAFLFMGWKIIKGEWREHILLWGWTLVYFAWQSINFTRAMRYQLAVYPTLAIIAAWGVFQAGNWYSRKYPDRKSGKNERIYKVIIFGIGIAILGVTCAWAYAFTRIYTRPVTRVAGSEWIYQNVPGAINLKIQTENGIYNQPQSFRSGAVIQNEKPLKIAFKPVSEEMLTGVSFTYLSSVDVSNEERTLSVVISREENGDSPVAAGLLSDVFVSDGDPRGKSYDLALENSVSLEKERKYYVRISTLENGKSLNVAGPISLKFMSGNGLVMQSLPDPVNVITNGVDYWVQFNAVKSGKLEKIYFPHIVNWEGSETKKKLRVSIEDMSSEKNILGIAEINDPFQPENDPRGKSFTLGFNQPVELTAAKAYLLRFQFLEGDGSIALYGSRQANESSWDDPLPVGLDGYNPFDYTNGVYRSELNFEMYWDDNEEKRNRFISTLDQADYIFISSNRQWGTTVRLPERYPLTTTYYRDLIGCPNDKDIIWCYSVAKPGMFAGNLGFDLVHIEQSEPTMGNWIFNTQFAEEAFTVYDHPKVLIFKKNLQYNSGNIRAIINGIDLSNVIHVTPGKAKSYPGNLMLPTAIFEAQKSEGTWSELFNRQNIQNKYPIAGAVIWYIAIFILGILCYPLTMFIFGSLPDKGYPVSRLFGLILLSYLVWVVSSSGLPFNRLIIGICIGILIVINGIVFYFQRMAFIQEIKTRKKYILVIEAIILLIFLVDLFVRIGNPDLWHPYKGGEKPMDFSYFNAVLKSSSFPPYDPWFAGGFINYYYYGFVIVGVLVKFLGIIPSIAYNLILPTLFAFVGIGAFSFGYNLYNSRGSENSHKEYPSLDLDKQRAGAGLIAGAASSIGMLFIGNLGTVRMIWQGFQRLGTSETIENAGWIQSLVWSFQGIINYFEGNTLPYGQGDWYWIPSRAIPGEPITEFPAFTFLYADPHAHMFALGITLLVILWALAIIFTKWRFVKWQLPASLLFGGLIIGSLRPTNTWDLPVYLGLGIVAVTYTALRHGYLTNNSGRYLSPKILRNTITLATIFVLVLFTFYLYQPFSNWYGQAYTSASIWDGDHTPVWSYLTHWGVFLFIITSWLTWETIDWMAKTPISSLNKLRPAKIYFQLGLLLTLAVIAALLYFGVQISFIAIPLMLWSAILLFRPGQSDSKRAALFMTAAGISLTMVVELVVLKGDIGRMNTVFKFYLQAWTLLSLSAAAGLVWVIPVFAEKWKNRWHYPWQIILFLLIGSGLLFPILAGADKINDRISKIAPHTLDGMAYMPYSTYNEDGKDLDLGHDYKAIIWMQDHVEGSPVIVEANTPEYRWGSRFTIYTGLPGVAGWNWHQRQQRAVLDSEVVTKRIAEISDFYNTNNQLVVKTFITKFDVEYIIIGQLERTIYPEHSLIKFSAWNGELWDKVYEDGDTVIYKVKINNS